ncbi:MAG TPA: RNA polymerase sigma factor [Burkholderiaceae bacterium]|nr:RNA polymerase sigma factor [Burkholderiaceae bacterium]
MAKLAVLNNVEALNDTALAARIAAGDEAALRLLMRRNNRTLFRAARSILGNDADAEDAVQEAYLAAFRGIDRFRGESRLSTWLTRIAINEALKRRRASGRADVIVLRGELADEQQEESVAESTGGPIDRPDHQALRAEVRRLIEAKIDALPDAFRTVFVLRAVEEMAVDEVAEALAIPEATVRTRFFRARAMLRESLAQEVDVAVGDAFGFDGARCDRLAGRVLAALRSGS